MGVFCGGKTGFARSGHISAFMAEVAALILKLCVNCCMQVQFYLVIRFCLKLH